MANQWTYYPYFRQMGPYFGQYYAQPAQQSWMGNTPNFPQVPSGSTIQTPGVGVTDPQIPGMLPVEQSYIENIFRLNKGKRVTVYMSFEGSKEWNSKIFQGIVEAAGRDHLILSDPKSGYRYLLPLVYFNYAVFEEELDYEYPIGANQGATYAPR
ncbi:spore coat protein GerQ [Fervidibacillus halotolerans]|uniref:Spore coat protein GerQ n=1 Tax=Fervidibacillus halotolerans TaxID=2980027 RepID=A0A9E8LYS7_9BACI|nr:spore coat protein GerQ [Fervidibacillus halotolerans]WAA12220.1 spore coat protein GerQ [Fervidibacillus halotolerans]